LNEEVKEKLDIIDKNVRHIGRKKLKTKDILRWLMEKQEILGNTADMVSIRLSGDPAR
jgi:hypothetical protein